MLAAVDVDYRNDHAVAACVLFRSWSDEEPHVEFTATVAPIAEYEPGQFYKRELPCLQAVLAKVNDPLDVVIVDGYVWLKDEKTPGLGARLFEALGKKLPVIGVAKTRFASARCAIPIVRGDNSRSPLFITSAGIDTDLAVHYVCAMHGSHRIPTLLRRVDQLCRGT